MADAIWDASLPQTYIKNGLNLNRQPTYVDDRPEVGKPRRRARFTASPRLITARYIMRDSQLLTLDEFHETTLDGGIKNFLWPCALFGDFITVEFVEYPEIGNQTKDGWEVTCQLIEVLS